MKYILNSQEMKQCDENTMKRRGMLSAVLMERAALAGADAITKRFPDPAARILVVCGSGNNGGDGVAVGRLLFLKDYDVTIYFAGNREKATVETERQLAIAENYGVRICAEYPKKGSFDVIVDAVFGIGLCREVAGRYAALLRQMNEEPAYRVAVDIASGVSANDGQVLGCAFRADLTVTFGFAKAGQLLHPGANYTGELIVADIGIDARSLMEIRPGMLALEKSDLRFLPQRRPHSNKGTYGKLLVIAGSVNMAGAAVFAARAAYRMGTGLVRVATPEENRLCLQQNVPEAVLAVYNSDTDVVKFLETQLSWADAVVVGPGLGTSKQAAQLVREVLKQTQIPCLLDADALNLLAGHMEWLSAVRAPLVLTPHLGEMSRLTGKPIPDIASALSETARSFAQEHKLTLVLKDARTVTAHADGQCWLNLSGNNGMATGGSGDVLTGVIGSLLSQGVDPELAAPLGVYVHGLAGDAAARHLGRHGMMALDIADHIADVLRDWEENQ